MSAQPNDDVASWLANHERFVVVSWRNPVLDVLGHHPASDYASRYWLPTLGPTTTVLHRHLVAALERTPGGFAVHLPTLGRELGVGAGHGRNAILTRSITRLTDFNLAEVVDGCLAVRPVVPPLSRRQVRRLPPGLAERHATESFIGAVRSVATARPLGNTATPEAPHAGVEVA